MTNVLSLTHLIKYEIELKDNIAVKCHTYQLASPKMQFLKENIQDLLEKGVVEPNKSAYTSPNFLVLQPNKKPWIGIDYRMLSLT